MPATLFGTSRSGWYATVILPLALPKNYTYAVPTDLLPEVQPGVRVEVPLGQHRLYAGIVKSLSQTEPENHRPKPIISVLDPAPIVTPQQLELWTWMAEYYCCSEGELMNAALPSALKLGSETKVVLHPDFDGDTSDLNDKEYLIIQALTAQGELTADAIRKLLQQQTIHRLLNRLLAHRFIYLKEELQDAYRPKSVICVRWAEPYRSDKAQLRTAFDQITHAASRQLETLMALLQLQQQTPQGHITRQALCERANTTPAVVKRLAEKGLIEQYETEVSRLSSFDEPLLSAFPLTPQQERALAEIRDGWASHSTILLQGVTGSGKTRVYIELIQEALDQGQQVLYLLPEIALTTQLTQRLQRVFGDQIAVYHSKQGEAARVELWKAIQNGKPIILGARSSLFMPFQRLGLIIVDEEHDPSFKQTEPAPRYNARDMALVLAHLHGARTLLGTATPSLETYHNAQQGKYGWVQMPERFGGLAMPTIHIANAKKAQLQRRLKANFTPDLLDALKQALAQGEQAILFQNRRGYAPRLVCDTCDWTAECTNCDISLTYHKHSHTLNCHLCGTQTPQPRSCPACGQSKLNIKGYGTERIEDELQLLLPDARLARMDWDTVKKKDGHSKLIQRFENRDIDILIGTQMVTKGLDFDNVAVVGVLSADSLLYFPDFRATERAFQLMTQVSGRAGRKQKQGKVIIQAFNMAHPVLGEVVQGEYNAFFEREIQERKDFRYPPFARLIRITLKHKKADTLQQAAQWYADGLKPALGPRVMGPAAPAIPRVRNHYLTDILIKLERKQALITQTKALLLDLKAQLIQQKGWSSVRINIDVDPY